MTDDTTRNVTPERAIDRIDSLPNRADGNDREPRLFAAPQNFPDRPDAAESVLVCPGCESYYEQYSTGWTHCPHCGETELFEAEEHE